MTQAQAWWQRTRAEKDRKHLRRHFHICKLVLEKPLNGVYEEIDVVTTPDGSPVAMVHCNNCCSELDAWVNMFGEFAKLTGSEIDKSRLYETLYKNAMTADSSCGGVTAYNCLSGEPVIKLDGGRPMYFRTPDSTLTLGSFFRAQLYSSFTALKIGMDILFDKEQVKAEKITVTEDFSRSAEWLHSLWQTHFLPLFRDENSR